MVAPTEADSSQSRVTYVALTDLKVGALHVLTPQTEIETSPELPQNTLRVRGGLRVVNLCGLPGSYNHVLALQGKFPTYLVNQYSTDVPLTVNDVRKVVTAKLKAQAKAADKATSGSVLAQNGH